MTRTDQTGFAWPVPIDRPPVDKRVVGSFRDAVQAASDMVHEQTNWRKTRFNDAPTIAIHQAADGAYELGDPGASIHLWNPIDSPKFVSAVATKTPGSNLMALVSFENWIDLRDTDAAASQRLLRVPGIGRVIGV